MSDEAYRAYLEYIEQGPDAVGVEGVRKALAFRSAEPATALRIDAAVERLRREEQERDAFVAAYILHGGSREEAHLAFERQAQDERARRAGEATQQQSRVDFMRIKGQF